MTHVQLSRTENGAHSLIVDGVDLSMHVLSTGLRVEVSEDPGCPDLVHLVVAADTLEADLPESVISAIRSEV